METAFLNWFNQVVLIAPVSGVDRYGKFTFGADVSYKARIEYVNQMIRTTENEERLSKATIFLVASAIVDPRSRLTLPDGYPTNPVIMACDKQVDETGLVHHIVLYI